MAEADGRQPAARFAGARPSVSEADHHGRAHRPTAASPARCLLPVGRRRQGGLDVADRRPVRAEGVDDDVWGLAPPGRPILPVGVGVCGVDPGAQRDGRAHLDVDATVVRPTYGPSRSTRWLRATPRWSVQTSSTHVAVLWSTSSTNAEMLWPTSNVDTSSPLMVTVGSVGGGRKLTLLAAAVPTLRAITLTAWSAGCASAAKLGCGGS